MAKKKITLIEPDRQRPESSFERESRERHEKLAAELVTEGLETYERAFLATCQMLYRQEHGCNTPFQKFFCSVVGEAEWRLPTPDSVSSDFEEFRLDWQDMKETAEQFVTAYAKVLHPKTQEAPGEAPVPPVTPAPTPTPRRGKKAA